MSPNCLKLLCFAPLEGGSSGFFDYSGYLTGSALLLVAWTHADPRYLFRIYAAPIAIRRFALWSLIMIGAMILSGELWRRLALPFIVGPIPVGVWPIFLASWMFGVIVTWAIFAFTPIRFAGSTARALHRAVESAILSGSDTQLKAAVEEMRACWQDVICCAKDPRSHWRHENGVKQWHTPKLTSKEHHAAAIIAIAADQRFCKALVKYTPEAIIGIASALGDSAPINANEFLSSIIYQAFRDPDSFVYHETSTTGFTPTNSERPIVSALFGNHKLATTYQLLCVPTRSHSRWRSEQWLAFFECVKSTFSSFVVNDDFWSGNRFRSFLSEIEGYVPQLVWQYETDDQEKSAEASSILHGILSLYHDLVTTLNLKKLPASRVAILSEDSINPLLHNTVADSHYKILQGLARASSGAWATRNLWNSALRMHNTSAFSIEEGAPARVVQDRVIRRYMRELSTAMASKGTFNSAVSVAAMILVTAGLHRIIGRAQGPRGLRLLRRLTVAWMRKHFEALLHERPALANQAFRGGFAYDKPNRALIVNIESLMRSKPRCEIISIDSTPG